MNLARSITLAAGFMAAFGLLMMFLVMGIQEEHKAEANKTPPKTAPVPAPTTSPPATPPLTPPEKTPEVLDNRGAVTRGWDRLVSAFDGYCSVRYELVTLTPSHKEEVINPHPNKCRVLEQRVKGSYEFTDEAGDPIRPGGRIQRDAVRVRLTGGSMKAVLKVSLCDRRETRPLDMNCSVLPAEQFK